jgi:hypothetical protein
LDKPGIYKYNWLDVKESISSWTVKLLLMICFLIVNDY